MRSLAEFLRGHRDEIVATWIAEARSLPSGAGRGPGVIRDRMPELVEELAHSLDELDSAAASLDDAAATHARDRFAEGYDVREVVTEYQLLRRVVLDVYTAGSDLPESCKTRLPPLTRLNSMIDAAICDAVDQFVEERDRAKDIFVGILGHDLRAPLQSIMIAAEALLERTDTLEAAFVLKAATRIRSSAKGMAKMIHDLLDFARGHLGGGIPIDPMLVDLRGVVGEIVDELAIAHPDRTLQSGVASAAGDFRGVWDPARVAQAVTNLVTNALEHGHDPIRVDLVDEDATIAIEISNGGALPPETSARLFKPFMHAAERRSGGRAHDGLGLGLYIVSEIARAHGGKVEAHSEDGTTRFRLRLPRALQTARRR
jgi:signal transduction histidine kinase